MPPKFLRKYHHRMVFLALLTLLGMGVAYYSHRVQHSDVVYSHLFYVPVSLAGLWFGRRGVWVGVILGASLLVFHALAGLDTPLREDLFRAIMFIVVGLVVGALSERAQRSEERLRQSNSYLDSLLRYANAPIIVWNPDFRVTRFNRAFERLTGGRASDYLGRPLDLLFPPDKREEALEHIRPTLAGERMEAVEIPVLAADGSVKTVLWTSASVYDTAGTTVIATIAQGQDVTERLRAADVLRRTERLTAMGRLAAGLAHEINNPLQAIRSHLELVLDFGLETDEREQYLGVCRQEIERLAEITQRVLGFARPSPDTRHPISVADLTEQTLVLVGKQLQHARVQVTTDFPADLPKVLVAPDQIVQVLLNILINATEVMPDGGHVHLAARAAGEMIVLTVSNDGPPIPAEHIPQIFDPFFSTKPTGTGLGLPISYGIVQAHGGTIRVENLHGGKGVRFTIKLPLAPRAEMTALQEASA